MSLQNNQSFLKLYSASGVADDKSLARARELAEQASEPKDLAVKMIRETLLTSWQAKFLLTGRSRLKVGKYSLLERLDRAQFGDRFVAMHKQLDRKVELQLLKSELNQNQAALKKFLEQSQKAAELDHPNLVHVYDIDQESDRYFLVVEHADGTSMDHDASVAQLNVSEIGMHLSRIVDGIHHAHQNGVIHGKIERENLLLTHTKQMMLGNLAMATLVLEVGASHDDLIRIGKTECDDWNAFGQTGLEMLDLAIPDVNDQQRRRLKTILSGYVKLREPLEEGLTKLKSSMDQWVADNLDVPNDNSSSFLNEMGLGDELMSAANASAEKPTLRSKNELENAREKQQADPAEVEEKKSSPLPMILGAVFAAGFFFLIAAGAVGYFVFFYQDGGNLDEAGNKRLVDNRKAAEANRIFSDLPDTKIGDLGKKGAPKDTTEDSGKTIATDKKNVDKKLDVNKKEEFDPFKVGKNEKDKETKVSVPVNNDKTGKAGDNKKATGPKTANPNKGNPSKGNPSKGNPKKGTPKTGNKKKTPPPLPPAYGAMPTAVGLPPLSDETAPSAVVLGKVICGPRSLLGMRLLMRDGIAPRNVKFELKRGTGNDIQRWQVTIKRKTREAKVAQIWRENDQIKFQWDPSAAKDRQAGYFQNCVLRLETRGEVLFLKLRQPFKIGDLAIDKKENETKKSFDLEYLPPGGLVYEVLRPTAAETQIIQQMTFLPINRRSENNNQPIFIFPTRMESARIYWIRIDVNASRKLRIESRFQVAGSLGDKRGREFSQKSVEKLRDEGTRISQRVFTGLEQLRAYQPKPEERTVHAQKVSEASKTLTTVNSTNAEIQRLVPLAEKMYELPIRFRVYFEIDGHAVDLATHDGKPFVLK